MRHFLKSVQLQSKSSLKVARGERELSEKDLVDVPKGLRPGEWIIICDPQAKRFFIAYINIHAESFFKVKILKEVDQKNYGIHSNEEEVAKEIILANIDHSLKTRALFKGYLEAGRLIYGANDGLPGLIVDKYEKYVLVQINTAGMDRFRDVIKSTFQKKCPGQKIIFFDHPEYRKAEILPIHENDLIEGDLDVVENGLRYQIPQKSMQKVGYYYDHRENRSRLKSLLERMNISKSSGLDLFSYVGSWGLHMLAAGVERVDFVDQGHMEQAILHHLDLNQFPGRGSFVRSDVFAFLDKASGEGKKYDVIVSDPPAFTKSEKNKMMAVQGYEKLHTKALKLMKDQGVMVVASCTHHVSHEELDKTLRDAAIKNNRRVQLLDVGVQGFDHPFSGFHDKSFYIKYLAYLIT